MEIDWNATSRLIDNGVYGFVVTKKGVKMITHFVTTSKECYSILTRERSDRWIKKGAEAPLVPFFR